MKKIILVLWILLASASLKLFAQNAPISTAGNVVSTGTTVILPITVTNFSSIGSCNLKLHFNPAIVSVTAVTANPLLTGGMYGLDFNNTVQGDINFGWFAIPAVSVPNNTAVFYIHFTKITNGNTAITWDTDGVQCVYSGSNGMPLNDSPFSTYYIPGSVKFQDDAPIAMASVSSACPGSVVSVPLLVTNFNTIGSVSLTMNYDPQVLTYLSGTNNAGFPGMISNPSAGTIIFGGFSTAPFGYTYPNNTTFITLNFTYLGGATGINFIDDGSSCDYLGPQNSGYPGLNDSPQSTYYINGSVIPSPTQWLGGISSSWENINNWSCGLPVSTTEVTINAATHYPEISSGVTVKNLTINSGSVTINPNATLTVSNILTNNVGNSGLLIKSDNTGTGSLLHYTADVPATIQRYITGSTDLSIYKYHFVSVPLQQSTSVTSNLFLGSYLFEFMEGTNQWHGLGAPTATGLSIDKGYMIYYPNTSITHNFSGKMNNGPLTINIPYSGSEDGSNTSGFSLVPNPYPSAIDWMSGEAGIFKFNIDNAIYIWPATGSASTLNYASYVNEISAHGGSRYIAQGQSFFIHANSTGAAFQIRNPSRLHNSVQFFKDEEIIPNVLRIKTVANEASDEMVVRFAGMATSGFDGDWDAYKLVGGANAPQLNSVASDDSKLCINALPFNENETVVPLNFSFSSATNVTFTASGMETFTVNSPIYLEDISTGAMVNLRDNPVYTFSYEPGSDENRFKLHFAKVVGIGEGQEPTEGTVYISGGELYIDVPSMKGQKTEIGIYNMLGQQLDLNRVTLNGMTNMPFSLPAGVYIVRVTSATQVFASKLVNN